MSIANAAAIAFALPAQPAQLIVLQGEPALCAPIVAAFCGDARFSGADIRYVGAACDAAALAGRHQDLAAVLVIWSGADSDGLVEQVAAWRRQQTDAPTPVVVRSTQALSAQARSGLSAHGVHGPCCREGLDLAALADDVLYFVDVLRERRALIAISEFDGDRKAKSSLTELAASALRFLRGNGIGASGGMFCFFRPTSEPEWVAVAAGGCFAAADRRPLAEIDPGLRASILSPADDIGEHCGAAGLTLRFVTPEGSRVRLHLAQEAPLAAWQRGIARVFCKRLAVVVDEVLRKRRLERMQHASIATLATVSEYRDVDTGNHVSRVSRIATAVAQILIDRGIVTASDTRLLQHIGHASILHDIGKVGIADSILLKPGPLDAEERRIMQTHTTLGHEILAKTAMTSDWPLVMTLAATVARSHHERYDGSGYPDGLAGDDIPLAARIVAVVDVFDALAGERPYKQPWPEARAIEFIGQQSGRHFDPVVVDAFVVAVKRNKDHQAVTWSAGFSVGHEGIDRDHQKLFAILNQIWLDKQAGNRLVVEMALDELLHYTRSHFAREEEYMASVRYPGRDAHRLAHQSFAARIEALHWGHLHGLSSDIHAELLDYLLRWLVDHIAAADLGYSRFVAALGADDAACAAP